MAHHFFYKCKEKKFTDMGVCDYYTQRKFFLYYASWKTCFNLDLYLYVNVMMMISGVLYLYYACAYTLSSSSFFYLFRAYMDTMCMYLYTSTHL